jgi:hypothetical protein
VDPTDGGVPKTIYYLQKITGFKNFCLVFDENTKEFPQVCNVIIRAYNMNLS